MARRLFKYAAIGANSAPPPTGPVLGDDTVWSAVSTGTIDVDVLANDNLGGPSRLTGFTATSPLPSAAVTVVGSEPAQKLRFNLAGLRAGVYRATYRAELIRDPIVSGTATSALAIAAAALPVASIRPLSSDRRPEGDIGTKNFIFAVERTGDLSAPASVSWSLESASDLESGQATSGTVGWLAGDGSGQQVEIAIKGDTTAEADQVCRIRIATPVGCTIGTAAASLTIIDDDAEHDINDGEGPTGYDQELAFGGVMLGTAVQDGQIGNLTIRNHGPGVRQNAIVLYLESDYPIVCMQTENRYDKFPLSAVTHNTGYSDHTVVRRNGVIDDAGPDDNPGNVTVVQPVQGGDLRWQVAKVTSAERDAAITLGPFVGETERINRAALAASWQLEFAKSGGTGSFGNGYNSFTMYPTIWFKQPIDPVALGWKIGDRIAFVVDNSARDEHGDGVSLQYVSAPNYGQSRWCSVNQPFRRNRPRIRSTYRYMRYAGCWWRNYKLEPEYCPMMLVGHKRPNGRVLVKGNAYGGYSGDVSVFLGAETGGITAIRQVLRIPNNPGWSGRRLLQADVSLWRSGGSTGVVTFAVKKAGTAIGDGADDGALLGAVDINAEELLYAAGGKMQRVSGDPHQWLRLPPDERSAR